MVDITDIITSDHRYLSVISGTVYFYDTVGAVNVVRSHYPGTTNDDVASGVVINVMRMMYPIFNGTQIAMVIDDATTERVMYVYTPATGAWTNNGQVTDDITLSRKIVSMSSNTIFMCGAESA